MVFVLLPLFGVLIRIPKQDGEFTPLWKNCLELNMVYLFHRIVLQHIIKIQGVSSLLNGSQSSRGGHHFVLNSPVLHLQHFNSSALVW